MPMAEFTYYRLDDKRIRVTLDEDYPDIPDKIEWYDIESGTYTADAGLFRVINDNLDIYPVTREEFYAGRKPTTAELVELKDRLMRLRLRGGQEAIERFLNDVEAKTGQRPPLP